MVRGVPGLDHRQYETATRLTASVLLAPVALIGLVHIVGGGAVLVTPHAAYVSQLAGLLALIPDPVAIAVVLIVVGAMAVTARLAPMTPQVSAALIAPQQIVLLVQLVGIGIAAASGSYPDGYVPVPGDHWGSVWFIVGDQAALILLCLSHTLDLFFGGTINATKCNYEMELDLREVQRRLAIYEEPTKWKGLVDGIISDLQQRGSPSEALDPAGADHLTLGSG
jgi:hypothetical protein